ncbi:hypothetical protein JCM9279_005357 [Rhodotorula babjevae]
MSAPLPSEAQLAPAFMQSPAPHRRRPSAPPSPPCTPTDACFPDLPSRSTTPPSTKRAQTSFPPSPPATPERAPAVEAVKARVAPTERMAAPPPPPGTGHRRPPSKAYAHHRRTSTATILRMAMAGASRSRPPSGGILLTPSKALTLFLIVLSATYVASFLPIPAGLRLAKAHPPHFQKPQGYVPPAAPYARAQTSRKVASPASSLRERAEYREALARRIPSSAGAARSVPGRREYDEAVAAVAAAPGTAAAVGESQDGEFWRAHPEALARGARPVRRGSSSSSSSKGQAPLAAAAAGSRSSSSGADVETNDTFDSPTYRRPESPEAIAAAQRAAYHEREAQLARMQRVAIAHREARRQGYVPVDSSAQRAVALAEQERLYAKRRQGSA